MKIEKEEHGKDKDTVIFLVNGARPWTGPLDYELDFDDAFEVMASFLVWLAQSATWRIEWRRQRWDYQIAITGDMDVCGNEIHVTAMSPNIDLVHPASITDQIKATLIHVNYNLKRAICEAVLGKSVFEIGRQLPLDKERNNVQ